MKFVVLVEVEAGSDAHLESWKQFGDVIPVTRRETIAISWALNRAAGEIQGPAWVALAEANEMFHGDGERARAELNLFTDRLLRPGIQMAASTRWVGKDYVNTRIYRPKIWFVPEGSTFGAEWEFRFELDVVVTSRKPTLDSALFGIDPSKFAIERRTSIRGPEEVARRKRIISPLEERLWTEAERQHYETAMLPEWSPVLSLCVLARGVDESLLRMLASARGHFSEVVLLLTRFAGSQQDDSDACAAVRRALEDRVGVPLVVEAWHDPDSFQLADGTWCIANFDRARQRSFDLAHGMFRMFLDSDDTLEWTLDGDAPPLWDITVKNFIEDTSVAFPYIYVPDSPLGDKAVHGLSQPRNALFRWYDDAGSLLWRWHRPLHERCVPTEWNPVAKHKNLCPDAGFVIKHHGSSDAHSHRERNRHIAHHALATREDLSPIDQAALEYVLATIALDEEGIGVAAPLYKTAMKDGAGDSYGLVAAIDLAAALTAAHRGTEVPELLLPVLESNPGDPNIMLALARAYRSVGQPYLALKWYWAVYQPKPEAPAGAEYRSVYADEQFLGRLEAIEVAIETKSYDLVEKMVVSAPPAVQARGEIRRAVVEVQRLQGDAQAARAALTLTHYLLSLDCVDRAQHVVAAFTPQIAALPHGVRARRMVERRIRHLRDRDMYQKTYDILNEADLVVKSKKHQTFLLDRIVRAAPKVFIDVGCNTGWLTSNIAQALPACRCIGIDISQARVEEAVRRVNLAGILNIEFWVDSAEPEQVDLLRVLYDLGHPSDVLVLISEVLEHVENPEDVLETWAIHASRIMITVPDVEAYYNLWPWARQLGMPLEKSERLGSDGAEHVRCYDAHQIVEHLDYAGLRTERVERIDISQNLVGEKEHDRSLLFVDASRGRFFADVEGAAPRRRIDIYAEGWVPWGPRAHLEGSGEKSRMVGGSEQAVIHLAPELVALGYEVHVYASPLDRREYERGVWWHSLGEFQATDPRDLVIVWRRAEHLLKCAQGADGRWPVWLWCHDVPDQRRAYDYRVADRIIVLSQYQRELYEKIGAPADRLCVLQNGVDADAVAEVWQRAGLEPCRFPHRVFYGSSGDRGLLHLLRMWPSVRAAVPDAELVATYRTDLLRWPTNPKLWFEIADEIERLATTLPGVTFYPGLPHDEYLATAAMCGVWAYPSNFEEISCIVAMETQALGLQPVATDLAALAETVLEGPLVRWETVRAELEAAGAEHRDGTFWSPAGCFSETFRDVLVDSLLHPMPEEDRAKLSRASLARYSWTRTAELFASVVEESADGSSSRSESID